MAGGDGAGDTAHLPTELKVILAGSDSVGMAETDNGDAQYEGDQNDECWRIQQRAFVRGRGVRRHLCLRASLTSPLRP
jgi:hypothetical protein